MDNTNIYLKLAALAIIIYLLRALPLLVLSKKELPGAIKLWLEYLTPSILAAIVFPSLFFAIDGDRLQHISPPYMAGAVLTAIAFYLSRKRIVSLLLGVVVFYLIHVYVK
jgi:branched-subunit amino acid transport protein